MKLEKTIIGAILLIFMVSYVPSIASDVVSTEALKFKMGYSHFGMMECMVAKEKQFYKKYLPNVEIEWHPGIYSKYLIDDWVAGKIEVSYIGDMPSIVLQNKVRDTKWVGVAVYPHGQVAAILVPHGSTVKSIKELDGKSVATGIGSSHHRILNIIAAKEGIKFNIVNKLPDEGLEELKNGKVDAACYWPPYLELAKQNNIGRVLFEDCAKYEPEVNSIWPVIASEKFIKDHPDIVKGIVKADIDLHKFMKEYPDEAAQIVYKGYEEKFSLSVVKASLASYRYSDTLVQEHIDTMQQSIDFLQSQGIIKTGFKASEWADTSFMK